ncbi:MAG: hypothetical protein KKA36_08180 [Gammaproteobacteria bacterium]|nr:hypothetical protein [Gammaproteobacteria bacterium]MBU2479053.1 hypothetical protein [Gammaproteobacteria bacterium]
MAAKPHKKNGFFRTLRIGLLLLLLIGVAGDAWLTRLRTTNWVHPLWVSVYPINADGSAATARYIATLSNESFAPVEAFFASEANRYGVPQSSPMQLRLAPELQTMPPAPPANGQRLAVMMWSLKMRFWAWNTARANHDTSSNIQVFVQYFDPALTDRVAHSLGLQKGLVGVVNAFASRKMTGQNNVVIAHELLHTVGATDKYDPHSSLPIHPQGFAEPDRKPLYPQVIAEIMGGRIPITERRAELPMSLGKTLVGPETAAEINWIKPAS